MSKTSKLKKTPLQALETEGKKIDRTLSYLKPSLTKNDHARAQTELIQPPEQGPVSSTPDYLDSGANSWVPRQNPWAPKEFSAEPPWRESIASSINMLIAYMLYDRDVKKQLIEEIHQLRRDIQSLGGTPRNSARFS